jgi:hypothetical protein
MKFHHFAIALYVCGYVSSLGTALYQNLVIIRLRRRIEELEGIAIYRAVRNEPTYERAYLAGREVE